MNAEQKKSAVRRYYDEVWCNGNVGLVDELFTANYENSDPANPGHTIGRDAFKTLVTTYREAFPDLKMEIVEQLCDGETVISRWLASGTQRGPMMGIPATGRTGKGIEGITLSTFLGDRIVRDRVLWDMLGMLRQLGAIPG
jgi:steroid delta-isomerase-like uncharacterized protein